MAGQYDVTFTPKGNQHARTRALGRLQSALGDTVTKAVSPGGYSSKPNPRSGEFTHGQDRGLAGIIPGTNLLQMIFMPLVNALRSAFGYTRSEYLQKDTRGEGTPVPETGSEPPKKVSVLIGPSEQEMGPKGDK